MVNFDQFPLLYLILVYGIGWVILVLTIIPVKQMHNRKWVASIQNDTLFLAIILLTLFLLRLPSICFNQEINPDESQQITQALTLQQNPVYFQSVDGTTGGPLNSYLLIIPAFFGFPFDYITARLVAFGLIAVSLILLFYTAHSTFGQRPARMALIPFVLLLGQSQTRDFVIYSSELLSIATLSGLYFLFASQYKNPHRTYGQLMLIGFLCGIVPFEKIQATLLAGAIGLFVVSKLISDKQLSAAEKWQSFLALAGGTLCFPTLFIGWLYFEGLFEDFVNFYLLGNLSYSQPLPLLQKILGFRAFLTDSVEFLWLMAFLAGIVLIWVFTSVRQHTTESKSPTISLYLLLLLLIALYSVIYPGTFSTHYLFYLFGPLMLLVAFLFSTNRTPFSHLSTSVLLALFMSCFSIRIVMNYWRHYTLNPFPNENQKGWSIPQNAVTRIIARYAHQGESLAVWGWRIDYYVRLQMPQATAENHTIHSIKHNTMKGAYEKRYAANMLHSLPPVFVDAVGKEDFYFKDRKTQGYEINKALRQIITTYYTYVGMTDDVRIFVRNDRFAHVTDNTSASKLSLLRK